jgi:Putative adhesin
MTLRIIFTLAILVGLAAAPAAQTFHWEPGSHEPYSVSRAIERVLERVERTVDRMTRHAERTADRIRFRMSSRADRIQAQVRTRIDNDLRNEIRADIRASLGYDWRLPRSRSFHSYSDLQGMSSTDPCDSSRSWGNDDYEQFCDVREQTMGAGPLTVDAGQNGGVQVEGWDRNEIRVQSIVRANARSQARAKELATAVQIQVGGGRVSASGPDTDGREWWSVSYRINVPRKNDLDLSARNGGITINGVAGNLRFDTNNGGVKLSDLAGNVRGSTRNGGLTVSLTGRGWDGDGIDVSTTNGGVTLSIPDGYNAQLEARTMNGGFRTDYPITVTGDLNTRRGVSTALGSGGAPVRVRTTNGGVKIDRR